MTKDDSKVMGNRLEALELENAYLKALLEKNNIEYKYCSHNYKNEFSKTSISVNVTEQNINRFFSYFWGRTDIFAKGYTNKTTGKFGYYTQCNNFWKVGKCPKRNGTQVKCKDCRNRVWKQLTPKYIEKHMTSDKEDGSDIVGIYPIFPDNTCRFIVFDFDNHELGSLSKDNLNDRWYTEVDTIRTIAKIEDIPLLVERSKSGTGAHIWIFFHTPIDIKIARQFGYAILEKGKDYVNLKHFDYYDRLLPMQDVLKDGELGNLIALPLQGVAMKAGNSVFVDEKWEPYSDQLNQLFATSKLTLNEVQNYLVKWNVRESANSIWSEYKNNENPWVNDNEFNKNDVDGVLEITIANQVYINASNLKPRLQNRLRKLASFHNPIFYKKNAIGLSTFDSPRYVYLGEDNNGFICLPRGLLEIIEDRCKESGIQYSIHDIRSIGNYIDLKFVGELRDNQKKATTELLRYETGILSAATAFGKTVVATYMISKIKRSTLILLESSSLIQQWEKAIETFLEIDEDLPKYSTVSGKVKERKSHVGIIQGAKDTSNGIIDIAMVGSLIKKGIFHKRIKEYGLVIVDECHHSASETMMKILQQVNAKYVYGVTATPVRSDGLEKINYMLLGPIRYKYSSKERATEQGIKHYVIPRFTRTVYPHGKEKIHINNAYMLIKEDENRKQLICTDIEYCLQNQRTPIVLTKYTSQAEDLYKEVKRLSNNVYLLIGKMSKKEQKEVREKMESIPDYEPIILIATSQLIGEGFDFPRLDTLIMATPVAWQGVVEQYAGRLNRDYPNKKDVLIYDYVDINIPVFEKMYLKRQKAYKQIGYELYSEGHNKVELDNIIYDYDTYLNRYHKDLQHANCSITISSPSINRNKIFLLLQNIIPLLEKGIKVTVVTWHPDYCKYENDVTRIQLIEMMRNEGIHIELVNDEVHHFAIIDNEIVWYGSTNLLGKDDLNDNIMRVINKQMANELLELTFGKESTATEYKLPI